MAPRTNAFFQHEDCLAPSTQRTSAPRHIQPFAMSGNRIMVGNLPYEADERAISDALGHLGHITDCKVRIDRWSSKIPT